MQESEVLNYVKSAAQAVGIPLDEARSRAVAAHLGRTVAMVRALDTAGLVPADELAEIFRPAPFPRELPA